MPPCPKWEIQYGRQSVILKLTSPKIGRLLPIYKDIVLPKFEVDIQRQIKVSSGNHAAYRVQIFEL